MSNMTRQKTMAISKIKMLFRISKTPHYDHPTDMGSSLISQLIFTLEKFFAKTPINDLTTSLLLL